tara:strand:- start:138 stop:1184 length:1047 start_codon:yes stop_codon:yes gene_type:complete
MKNVLITGGCGFIGSEAVRRIIKRDYKVFNFDKLTYASCQESLFNLPKDQYSFFHGDIYNSHEINKFINFSKPTYILNFAAESHVDRSIENPDNFINTNIIGTYNLLNESLNYYSSLDNKKKKNFKFIHVSTDEVYGSLSLNDRPFTEEDPYRPNSPYSSSKASSDFLVRSWNKTYNLPTIITHSSNNYGPWQFPEKLIPLTVLNALKGKPIQVYGDGSNIRDWIHVEDHVDALIKIMESDKVGETFNIGGSNELTNIDLVNKICDLLEIIQPNKKNKYSDLIEFVKDRPGHDNRYAISIEKIKDELSWEPKIQFSEGLNASIKWMLDNFEWLSNKSSDERRIGLKKI